MLLLNAISIILLLLLTVIFNCCTASLGFFKGVTQLFSQGSVVSLCTHAEYHSLRSSTRSLLRSNNVHFVFSAIRSVVSHSRKSESIFCFTPFLLKRGASQLIQPSPNFQGLLLGLGWHGRANHPNSSSEYLGGNSTEHTRPVHHPLNSEGHTAAL